MDRLRRLSLVFLGFGLFLPAMPHALGFPHDRLYCFDIRVGEAECGFFGLGALLFATVIRAYVASRESAPWQRWLWSGLAFVAVDVFLIPFELALIPYWHWDALR